MARQKWIASSHSLLAKTILIVVAGGAKQSMARQKWIASSHSLLAKTGKKLALRWRVPKLPYSIVKQR
jgi:hypothetical protein